MSKLSVNQGKGFYLEFENGFGISVQFGTANYCEHNSKANACDWDAPEKSLLWESSNAEIAIMDCKDNCGGFYHVPGEDDNVIGYVSADEVADWITYTKNLVKGGIPQPLRLTSENDTV